MPKFLEDKLKSEASAEGKTGRDADRYVYGALNNMGAMKGNKETAAGRAMAKKHAAKMASPRTAVTPPVDPTASLGRMGQHPHRNLGKWLHAPKGSKGVR